MLPNAELYDRRGTMSGRCEWKGGLSRCAVHGLDCDGDLADDGRKWPRSRETSRGSFIGSVVLHTTDCERGAAFWRDALGYVSRKENAEFLVPPE